MKRCAHWPCFHGWWRGMLVAFRLFCLLLSVEDGNIWVVEVREKEGRVGPSCNYWRTISKIEGMKCEKVGEGWKDRKREKRRRRKKRKRTKNKGGRERGGWSLEGK